MVEPLNQHGIRSLLLNMNDVKGKNIPIKSYCGRKAWFNKKTGKQSIFFCGLASCGRDYCQKLYYFKRTRLISHSIVEYDLKRFFTLTMDRKALCSESWKKIPYIWHKALTILKRKYSTFLFNAILEAHKDGYPHIHGFTNTYIPIKVWSHIFNACGGGKIAYVERIKIKDGDISQYVNKELNIARYVGKDQVITARQMLKSRARSFWRSQGMYTEEERKRKEAGKSDTILVWEDIYKETEKGFDKLMKISYDREYDSLRLTRI